MWILLEKVALSFHVIFWIARHGLVRTDGLVSSVIEMAQRRNRYTTTPRFVQPFLPFHAHKNKLQPIQILTVMAQNVAV